MNTTQFEREWKRLLKFSRKAADALRREHNRQVMYRELFEYYEPNEPALIHVTPWMIEVTRIENGKATAKRVRTE